VKRSVRTPTSPRYFATMRSKLVQEIKSITCEKRVRPAYTVTSPRNKQKSGKRLPPES
jgi:hypothetical protein